MGYKENLERLRIVSEQLVEPVLDAHPNVSAHASVTLYSADVNFHIYEQDGYDAVETLKAVRRSVGSMEKKQGILGMYLKQDNAYDDGSRLGISIYPASGTCERVKVGTKVVEKPDPNVEVPTVEVEEDVYEWECKGVNI